MILITNDDGISSPGILALRTALADLDSVFVVAPDRERSSIGMAITLHREISCYQSKRSGNLTLPIDRFLGKRSI